jgi:hypothetical protein
MKKNFKNVMAIVAALGMICMAGQVMAADATDNDDVIFTLDNPPYLAITNIANPGEVALDTTDGVGTSKVSGTWTVTSNSGYDINFTDPATNLNADGSDNSSPEFFKLDRKADGTNDSTCDVLTTEYGIDIAGSNATTGTAVAIWGGGNAAPAGTSANLILGLTVENSPDHAIGNILAGDSDGGVTTVQLTAEGTSTINDQAGDYTVTVELTATTDSAWD